MAKKKFKRPSKGYLEYGDLSKAKTRSPRGLYPSGKDIMGKEAGYGLNYPETERLVANKPKPIPKKSLAPEKSVRPKARPKPRPSQALSPREQSERRTELEQYKAMGIPEGSVPATAMPKGNMMLSARERAEMGMKKGRKVKKMMGGGMMKKKGMKKGGKVRGAGIARKGVRPAKMR